MLLSIRNTDVSYGGEAILKDVSFDLKEGEKLAVVGRNGCGKTTLLKLIMGELTPDARDGDDRPMIAKTGDPVIGSLSQLTFEDESISLREELKKVYRPLLLLKQRMDELSRLLEENADEALAGEYAEAQERFNYLGGYRFEKDFEMLISRFGFSEADLAKSLTGFSGGQRTKIAFIKLLLSKPDILLLDEPTNHLDISTIAWLEGYIREYPRAVIVVSHDRLFLDRVAERVVEIERGKLTSYPGNYSDFVKRKKEEREQQMKLYLSQQKEKERLEQLAERFIHKATKASMARSKLKAVEHMELVEKPEEEDNRAFRGLATPARESGRDVLTVENLGIGYDKPLLKVNLKLMRGKKLGVIGGNGLGKSTFVKTLMKKIPAKSGKITFGYGVEAGYFEQQMSRALSTKTVIDEFWDDYPTLTETEVRNILGGFLFTGDDVFRNVSELSGGERVRLSLAKLLQTRPNLLILDEPTNHMDIVGREALEEMLSDYTGTLIFVSHDRYLVRRLADELLIFRPGEAEYFPWGFEEYERHYGREKTASADEVWKIENGVSQEKTEEKPKEKKINPGRERARMQRRIARLEELVEENDGKIAALKESMSDPEVASDYQKLSELQKEIDELQAANDAYMEEWEGLSAEVERSGEEGS
ncbi:MAG: ABC-F family ATP-binding cassette domain-containing protein [Lachnospiraceae bacterium]|nr:ABC-F family ATP-binding cassette domain-containing protein [Lachnospiraceae bacterium]